MHPVSLRRHLRPDVSPRVPRPGRGGACVRALSLQLSDVHGPPQPAVRVLPGRLLQTGIQLCGPMLGQVRHTCNAEAQMRTTTPPPPTPPPPSLHHPLFSHYGNNSTMVCDRCDPSCDQCGGPGNRNCLSCRQDFVLVKRWGQCLRSCPAAFYLDQKSRNCHKCHPTCKTCSGKDNLNPQSRQRAQESQGHKRN